jgi:non-heme chloroperoxidase
MKPTKLVALAAWMLDHLTFGLTNEALCGDLLEELQRGRPAAWFWRQVGSAIVAGVFSRLRDWALPAIYCVGWCSLYRGWSFLGKAALAHGATASGGALSWPYSALETIGYGVLPAATFVWLGFLVYLLSRPSIVHELSVQRLFWGLSVSLNVLLISTFLLLRHFRHSRVDLHALVREDFYSAYHLWSISIPLALSLLAALSCTVMRTPRPRPMRRRGVRHAPFIERVPRGAHMFCFGLMVLGASCALGQPANGSQAGTDTSPHAVQFVSVDKDVKLEVLDWGGTGQPLIFLAGLGNDAHVFDSFAPKFTAQHRVIGITRRGFGASSKPSPETANYSADRLGDDVLAVMTALNLKRPVLAGHSLAGEELSSIGSRFPEKVAGLIYLDAGYGYAYYDKTHGDTIFDFFQLKKQLDGFTSGQARDPGDSMEEMAADVSALDRDLDEAMKRDPRVPELHAPSSAIPPIVLAINLGGQRYTRIPVPILAIFACPHNFDFDRALRSNPGLKAEVVANDVFTTTRQADAFAAGVPSARIVRLANADHYVFRSNEADVIREMNAFLSTLK